MVTFNLAVTVPVNPPDVSLKLTKKQVFAGFQFKIRNPQQFVPAIASCKVLSDADGVVVRLVTFKEAAAGGGAGGHPKDVRETCTEKVPCRVDFALDNGSSVINIVSEGAGAGDHLYVTYIFAWKHDDMEAGSEAAVVAEARYRQVAEKAVMSSIATTRQLVEEGKI